MIKGRLLPSLFARCELQAKNLSDKKKIKFLEKLVDECFKEINGNYFSFFKNEYNFIDFILLKELLTTENSYYENTERLDKYLAESHCQDLLKIKSFTKEENTMLIDSLEFIRYVSELEDDAMGKRYFMLVCLKSGKPEETYEIEINLDYTKDENDTNYIETNILMLNRMSECIFKEYMRRFILKYVCMYKIDGRIICKLDRKYELFKGEYTCL